MESEPHLTLVLPVYNARQHLTRMLRDLAVARSIPRWDVVLVDDGSSEDLLPLVAEAQAAGIPLSYVRLDCQSGPGEARNAGLRVAKGSHVAFVDVDDHPSVSDFIALMDAAQQLQCPIAAGRYQIVSSEHDMLGTADSRAPYDIAQVNRWSERLHEYPAIWSFVIQRQLLEDEKIGFPSLAYAEDVVFLVRLSQVERTYLQTLHLVYSHKVSDSDESGSASSATVAASTVLETLRALREEGLRSPREQRSVLASWRLRIAGRMLSSRADMGLDKRAALTCHLAGVLVGHPVQSVRTLRQWASKRTGGSLSAAPAQGRDDFP